MSKMEHAALLTRLELKNRESVALTCRVHSFYESGVSLSMGQWEWVHLRRLHTEPFWYQAAQGFSFMLVMRGSSMHLV